MEVKSRKDLRFGEQVMLGHIATVVTAVDIHTEKGELVTSMSCPDERNPDGEKEESENLRHEHPCNGEGAQRQPDTGTF